MQGHVNICKQDTFDGKIWLDIGLSIRHDQTWKYSTFIPIEHALIAKHDDDSAGLNIIHWYEKSEKFDHSAKPKMFDRSFMTRLYLHLPGRLKYNEMPFGFQIKVKSKDSKVASRQILVILRAHNNCNFLGQIVQSRYFNKMPVKSIATF